VNHRFRVYGRSGEKTLILLFNPGPEAAQSTIPVVDHGIAAVLEVAKVRSC
jgi:hypothetical protein